MNKPNRFFPPPKFLSMPSVGLDISNRSVKFAELLNSGDGLQLGRFGSQEISPGVVEDGEIKDLEKLAGILKTLGSENKFSFIRTSLPEEKVYVFNLKLPKVKESEINGAIELQLEKYIPIPAQESIFDYGLIDEDENYFSFQVTAVSKSVISAYLDLFKQSGLTPISFETEAQSISRAVISKGDEETYMIVDLGDDRTGISIVEKEIVKFTSTIKIGGSILTEMVQKGLKVNFAEAETIKRKYGLKKYRGRREIFSLLLNGISILRDEINKHFIYWHTHPGGNSPDKSKIKKIILCGGNANLIGLNDYLSASMRAEVELANVWGNINNFDRYIPEIDFKQSLSYAVSLGLALSNFKHD